MFLTERKKNDVRLGGLTSHNIYLLKGHSSAMYDLGQYYKNTDFKSASVKNTEAFSLLKN